VDLAPPGAPEGLGGHQPTRFRCAAFPARARRSIRLHQRCWRQ
jgi:hypothetical protein